MKAFYSDVFKNYFLLTVTLMATEIIFRLLVGSSLLDWAMLRIFIGVNIVSLVLAALYSFCGRIAGNILCFITSLAGTIYALIQVGFIYYIGAYMSFNTTSQATAVKDYVLDFLQTFKWNYWLLFVPVILMVLFYIFVDPKIKVLERNDTINFADKFDTDERKKLDDKIIARKKRRNIINGKINAVIIAIVLCLVYAYSLTAPFMQNEVQLKTTKQLFSSPDMPNIAIGQFGYTGYIFVDVKSILFPATVTNEETSFSSSYQKKEQVQSDYTRNIDDLIWEQVIENSTGDFKTLSNYFISQEITDKNDYTGIFEGKNLIVIMMESTTNIAINEEYYPNLYKLYSEGWAWTNAYSPRNSCSTGNNEMSGMVSLFTINNSCTANRYKDNVYPESMFNLFNDKGYTTSSYHNYTDQYYYRNTIHKNMGSGTFYGVEALGIPYSNVYQEWPSDVDLVKKFLEKTEDQDQYMAWLTSVSAHQPYTQSSELGDKYLDLFADTNYNISLKRYMSKLKEFDNAIGVLLEGLEEQGKLEDTVIVLYGDHYPYGLSTDTLNTYFDYDVTVNNEVDRTPFIIYNSEIKAQKFDDYTTYMNILPTLANLFDLDYDPRLYMGHDIMDDDYNGRIIFADGSWQDKKAFYNASTGKLIPVDKNDSYTNAEVVEINKEVSLKISMSNLAIKTNYFYNLETKINEYKAEKIDSSDGSSSG